MSCDDDQRPATHESSSAISRSSRRASLVFPLGTAGFHIIEGWSWFDGFYMVITTFTTIGYQEVHPLSHAGRVFNVGLIIAGVSLVFLVIGSLTQALLEFELAASSEGGKWNARSAASAIITSFAGRDAWAEARRGSWRTSACLSSSSIIPESRRRLHRRTG